MSPKPLRKEYRVPRAETERVADALAARLRIDPENVPCDFVRGSIEVRVEDLIGILSSADELAEALDDLLASVPPRHSYPHEVEAFERAQDEAAAVLARHREGRQA